MIEKVYGSITAKTKNEYLKIYIPKKMDKDYQLKNVLSSIKSILEMNNDKQIIHDFIEELTKLLNN